MANKKRKILAVALTVVLIALIAHSTLAYYTVVGKATNVVTSGNIKLSIQETTEEGKPFPQEGVTVIPGDTVGKVVTIKNVCGHPFWLRVDLVMGDNNQTVEAGEALKIVDLNANNWVQQGDHYYYYRILQPGETTEPIFTQVHIVGNLVDQHDVGSMLSLTVKASAVQSENNPAQNPWEASGWPEA